MPVPHSLHILNSKFLQLLHLHRRTLIILTWITDSPAARIPFLSIHGVLEKLCKQKPNMSSGKFKIKLNILEAFLLIPTNTP